MSLHAQNPYRLRRTCIGVKNGRCFQPPMHRTSRFPQGSVSTEIRHLEAILIFHFIDALCGCNAAGILLIGRKKDGSRLVIAGAAIPVLDFRGHLVQGKQSIRLWPHEDVQCARDPKLGKGENLPKNLRLDSGVARIPAFMR